VLESEYHFLESAAAYTIQPPPTTSSPS
jgi:hypothetical protein